MQYHEQALKRQNVDLLSKCYESCTSRCHRVIKIYLLAYCLLTTQSTHIIGKSYNNNNNNHFSATRFCLVVLNVVITFSTKKKKIFLLLRKRNTYDLQMSGQCTLHIFTILPIIVITRALSPMENAF